MPEIKIANQDTLLDVKTTTDNTNVKIGTSGDTASSAGTSLFSRINRLITDWTTAKAGYVDSAISGRASQTDMTAVKNLLGIANPTVADMNTVMNALKKISETSGDSKGLQYRKYTGTKYLDSGTTTVLDVSGKGFLQKLSTTDTRVTHITSTSAYRYRQFGIIITLDGVQIFNFPVPGITSSSQSANQLSFSATDLTITTSSANATYLNIAFKQSLKIELVGAPYDSDYNVNPQPGSWYAHLNLEV
jgi:hypothetical protein